MSRSSSEWSEAMFRMSRSLMCTHDSRQGEDSGVDGGPLLERGAQRPVQAVLQIHDTLPLHHVREQVAIEGGVLGQQPVQRQLALGGDELIQTYRTGWDLRPLLHAQ